LFTLPAQYHPLRGSLMLAAGEKQGDPPRLDIEYPDENPRLQHLYWRRPVEIDLRRFGLLDDALAARVFG
jgi:hypothetical protein